MVLNNFLVLKASITLAFGIAFVLLKAPVKAISGAASDPTGALMTRFIGACLVSISLICWLDRATKHEELPGSTLSIFIGDTIGFLVALFGLFSGMMDALGWMVIFLWLLLVMGLRYFHFKKPSVS